MVLPLRRMLGLELGEVGAERRTVLSDCRRERAQLDAVLVLCRVPLPPLRLGVCEAGMVMERAMLSRLSLLLRLLNTARCMCVYLNKNKNKKYIVGDFDGSKMVRGGGLWKLL